MPCSEMISNSEALFNYPFGMIQPGRSFSSGDGYRYGFQGQEMDDEVKGNSNSISYKYRMHDPRIGRFFSIDPLAPKYPHYSPYMFSGNKVIAFRELEGLEELGATMNVDRRSKTTLSGNHIYVSVEEAAVGAVVFTIVTAGTLAEVVGGWWALGTIVAEEAAEAGFEYITGIPVINDPIDVLEKGIKKGLLEGGWDGLESWERKRAAEYVEDGKSLQRIDATPNGPQQADWIIDGKKTEFKSLTGDSFNQTTALGHLQKATKKDGVQVIDLDIRTPGGTKSDASSLYERFKGTDQGKSFTGEVRIATDDGLVTFPGSN